MQDSPAAELDFYFENFSMSQAAVGRRLWKIVSGLILAIYITVSIVIKRGCRQTKLMQFSLLTRTSSCRGEMFSNNRSIVSLHSMSSSHLCELEFYEFNESLFNCFAASNRNVLNGTTLGVGHARDAPPLNVDTKKKSFWCHVNNKEIIKY